jgi:hypothetical protein
MEDRCDYSVECLWTKRIPDGKLKSLWPDIASKIPLYNSSTPVYLLASVLTIFQNRKAGISKLEYQCDIMGGIEMELIIEGGGGRIYMQYEQSIRESWSSVERTVFVYEYGSPGPEQFSWDLNLNGSGVMNLRFSNITGGARGAIADLAAECFEEVRPLGARARESVAMLRKTDKPGEAISAPPSGSKDGVRRLEAALDEERNAYMEWHDGPDFSSVAMAISRLLPEERQAAVDMIAGRLEKGYDFYLGYAAIELGKDEGVRARLVALMENIYEKNVSWYDASHLAHDILLIGPSEKAKDALRRVIREAPDWSSKIEGLVYLRAAMKKSGGKMSISELFPPETAETVFEAVRADDYLVRYHAANAILHAAGMEKEVSEYELFSLVCGKNAVSDDKPTKADREGFEKAVVILREVLYDGRKIS